MSGTTTTRTFMCLSVRGAIREISAQRKNATWLNDDNGKPLTKSEALTALMDELVKGHEVIPMSPKCSNPCGNSDKCAGFDFIKCGCPGYLIETDEVTQ